MRRALVGIVPDELLNRKRKAFPTRSPITAVSEGWEDLAEISGNLANSSLQVVDPAVFSETLQKARRGEEVSIVSLLRAAAVGCWLRRPRYQKAQRECSGIEGKDRPTMSYLTKSSVS